MRARDNPFRSTRIDGLAFRDPTTTPDRLLVRWQQAGRRGALIGPHGTGKTTLLAELVQRIEAGGRPVIGVRLRADGGRSDRAAIGCEAIRCRRDAVLCVDGFDLLPGYARRVLAWTTRRLHGVIVTAHAPCLYPTLHETRTSPELLAELATELLSHDPDAVAGAHRCPDLTRLHADCGGNLRDALFGLYRACASDRRLEERPQVADPGSSSGPPRSTQ